jgi:hypothetical protein
MNPSEQLIFLKKINNKVAVGTSFDLVKYMFNDVSGGTTFHAANCLYFIMAIKYNRRDDTSNKIT